MNISDTRIISQSPHYSKRRLNRIYFYTSSMEKYLQARLLFDRSGLTVDYFKSKTEPYDEDYRGTSQDLLGSAITQVTGQVGRGHLVFVEDTSLRIEALSSVAEDVPGMQVKHWFADTTFDDLDSELRANGGSRRAIVKSDIALKLPGLERPVFFHGETHGRVADAPPTFPENIQYPWLTPSTFNGWFIPDGEDLPLGALDIEQALRVDFRAKSLVSLLSRLEEYAAALNLPPSAYRRPKTLGESSRAAPTLFDDDAPALLVVGRTCAGKTTFAEYASGHRGLLQIEASTIVRSLGVDRVPTDDVDGFSYAMRVLDTLGHDVVVREIIRLHGSDLDGPFVVSGLRDVQEIRAFRNVLPRVRVVLIEASERTRFERHILRGRAGAERTLTEFRSRDIRQDQFGLLPVVDDLADIKVINEEKIEDYHQQIDSIVAGHSPISGVDFNLTPRHGREHHQLYRCLAILSDAARPLQCDEIEMMSAQSGGVGIRHNNANKVLRAVGGLAERLDPERGEDDVDAGRVRYRLTDSGRAFIDLYERKIERGADGQ